MALENKEKDNAFLNMSDEDMMNVDPSTLVDEPAVVEPESEPVVEDTPVVETQEESKDEPESDDGVQETVEGQASEERPRGLLEQDSGTEKAGEKTESTQEQKVPDSEPTEIDYKAEYEKLLTPFKANGREIAVKSIEDAVSLMQMGANYNKKMAALKPNLKLMKLLENNGLLDEAKLSFLIDLDKKKPEAISKLVQESGLDPLEMDTSKAGDYKPSTYAVDDREIELDAVLDEIQATPTYNQTLHIVSNKWDGASKQVIANSPQLLKVINSHVESGIYDLISKEIESERMFGRLDGLSDIEAYRQVGDAIQARGGFNHLAPQVKNTPAKPIVVQPKPKSVDEEKLREKKRAASSTKPASASVSAEYNPLALSDDAFSKLVNDQYL